MRCLSIVKEAAEDIAEGADGGPQGSLKKPTPLNGGWVSSSDEDAVEVSRDSGGGGLALAAELNPTRAHAALSPRVSAADAGGAANSDAAAIQAHRPS